MMNRKTLALALTLSVLAGVAAKAADFRDTRYNWANPAIDKLVERGVMVGYSDNTFRPNQLVTRAEFTELLSKFIDSRSVSDNGSSTQFNDLPQTHWAYPAVERALSAGLIQGYPSGQFRPDRPVTRGEALAVLSKLTVGDNPTPEQTSALLQQFGDRRQLPEWLRTPIAKEAGNHILKQTSYVGVNQPLTRAEMAFLLNNLITHNDVATTPMVGIYHQYAAVLPQHPVSFRVNQTTEQTAYYQKPTFSTTTTSALSTENSRVGDNVSLILNESLKTADGSVAPTGSKLIGQVTQVHPSTRHQTGYVTVAFNNVVTPEGRTLPIKGTAMTQAGFVGRNELSSGYTQGTTATDNGTYAMTGTPRTAPESANADTTTRGNVSAGDRLEVKLLNVSHYGDNNQ